MSKIQELIDMWEREVQAIEAAADVVARTGCEEVELRYRERAAVYRRHIAQLKEL